MRWLDSIADSMDINLSKHGEIVKDMGSQRVGHDLVTNHHHQLLNILH